MPPPVTMLPKAALPATFNVPDIFAPVPVTTNIVLPTAVILTLLLATGIDTSLLPFAKVELELMPIQLKLPAPSVCRYCPLVPPVITTLPTAPKLLCPVTFNVPAIFAPVPVTTNVVLPTAVRLILPLDDGIFTLLLPFATPAVVIPVRYTPLPVK